jgi:uncharacterized protein with PIN domain
VTCTNETCGRHWCLPCTSGKLETARDQILDLQADNERLRQDRADALNVTSREGLLASEWVLRAGRAERERDVLLAKLESSLDTSERVDRELQAAQSALLECRRERDSMVAAANRLREVRQEWVNWSDEIAPPFGSARDRSDTGQRLAIGQRIAEIEAQRDSARTDYEMAKALADQRGRERDSALADLGRSEEIRLTQVRELRNADAQRDSALADLEGCRGHIATLNECLDLYRSGRIGAEEFGLAHERLAAEEIATWLESTAIGHEGNRRAYAAQIRNGNWRKSKEQP